MFSLFPGVPQLSTEWYRVQKANPLASRENKRWDAAQRKAQARPPLITFTSSFLCSLSCFCTFSWDLPSANHCEIISVSESGSSEPELSCLFNKYLLNPYFVSGFMLNSWDSEISILWFFLSEIGFGGRTVWRQLREYEKDHNRGSLFKKKLQD